MSLELYHTAEEEFKVNWPVLNPNQLFILLVICWETWPWFAHLLITIRTNQQKLLIPTCENSLHL